MNKTKLLEKIRTKLEQDLEMYFKVARASHEEATDPQNKAENKYDTRGLEAAYLAGGQVRQAAETEAVLICFRQLVPRKFEPNDAIDLTALVEVKFGTETTYFFIAPRGGGLEVMLGKVEITVLTPQSPLGEKLMGRKAGDTLQKRSGQTQHQLIVSVS
ncbi:MAG: hypothetical protein EXS23_04535 [Pedosphaera sp.]|nr:hypothetical protein [Pedosphaera sp.]